jgi:hypothetical protein
MVASKAGTAANADKGHPPFLIGVADDSGQGFLHSSLRLKDGVPKLGFPVDRNSHGDRG